MTVRLLKPYAQRPVGAIATFDPSTEAGMIAAKQASADLTGGFEYFLPRPGLKLQALQVAVGSITLHDAEQAPVLLPEGQVLNVAGAAGAVGKIVRLSAVGSTVLQSWTIGAGSLQPIGPFAGQQRFLVTCSAGSVDVAVEAGVLGAARVAVSGALVDPLGNVRPLISRPIRNICTIGDSVVELSQYFGLSFNSPTLIFGSNTISVPRGSLNTPDGAGTLALTYVGAQPYLAWTAPTDTAGPPVPVRDGIYALPSNNPAYTLTIGVVARWLSATAKSETLNSNAGQRYWRRPAGGFPYIADALTYGRFNWQKPLGIGGNNSVDIGNRYSQALASGADLIIDRSGGNDVVSGSMTIAESVAARLSNWRRALAAGIPVIVLLMSARSSGVITAAKNSTIVAANAAYRAAGAGLMGVYFVDTYTQTVDSATGYAKTGYLSDGIHWLGGAAYEAAVKIATILNTLAPDDRNQRNVGLGSYYDATNNPGGNLLPSNQGAFAGTGGTAGTGATVGTGIAAGINVSAAAPCVVTCNKVMATDGGPDWQEYVISGATADGQSVKTFFGTPVNPAPGSLVTMSVEYEIEGAGCYGIYMDSPITAPVAYLWDAHQLDGVVQGMRPGGGVVAYEPIVWPAGVTASVQRIFIQSKAGANFKVRLRNADFRMVI